MKEFFVIFIAIFIQRIHCRPIEDDVNYEDRIDLSEYGSKVFGQPNLESGERLKQWQKLSLLENTTAANNSNPEEIGTYLEGDILFPINRTTPEALARNGMVAQSYRWPNAIIPFEIVGSFDARSMGIIENAMNMYHQKTCIKFQRRSGIDRDYISIQSAQSGCWSSVGRIGGAQVVNLQQPACTTLLGTVLHELMHSVGFLHEQNREERDQFIDIMMANIRRGYETNFIKANKGTASGFGVGYDYGSVMHYSATAFSTNGQPTIVPKSKAAIGQRDGFSPKDIQKINNMYKCKGVTSKNVTSGANGLLDLFGIGTNQIHFN